MNRFAYVVVGVIIIAVITAVLALPGADLGGMIAGSDPGYIIASKDCRAASLLTIENLGDATTGQQLGIIRLLGDCISTGEIESVSDTREAMRTMSKNVKYDWPESAGNSLPAGNNPDNPIELPYTLDENYMKSDDGIGGCELTINAVERVDGSTKTYLHMTVKPTRDVEYCQLNGLDGILEEYQNNKRRAHGDKEAVIKNGDVLVGIKIHANPPDGGGFSPETLFGFVGFAYVDKIRFNGHIDAGYGGSQPRWNFDNDEETGTWSPGLYIGDYREATGWGLFSGYTYTSYPRSLTNVEFIFLDVSELDEIKGDKVSFRDPDIQYSKYFDASP
ncbi:MAG: hypothetical protein EB829_00765 [Nitrosopumilus sp. H8]|nr:MAG: hypothetical protein EB829_00765 [Nitrosopumilus sp. H8]